MSAPEVTTMAQRRLRGPLAVRVLGNAWLIAAVAATLVPFLYVISASLMPNDTIFSVPFRLFPRSLYLDNYAYLVDETGFVRWFLNSGIIALARTLLAIALSLSAGYAFAKFEFRFKKLLFGLVIGTLTLPIYVILIPLFNMMTTLGWTDTYWALILPFTAQAIGVFLARQYMLTIPTELIEAARIDGASEWTIFRRIIVPLSQPTIAVMGILFFTASWNDYLWPLITVTSSSMFTVSLGLPALISPYNQHYGSLMAGSFLGTLPIIVIFLVFQKRFIAGILAGSLKG
ncbi:carbohydrate ABC transporter permease [Pseudonocardia sp.]|jgi:ABC-type glycerol-3-phosphate transport system permease component|uniref:carbohydrate ABC transporter permease n=1 Tax=Pseudonocardia sp. TaxID=60912 RepID=UPI00260AE047|nr:carbohydrate ABC transporter permease [Pseudonocardia sp.]